MFKPYTRNKREINKLFRLIGNRTKVGRIVKRLLQNNLHKFMLIKENIEQPYFYRDLLELGENTRLVINYDNICNTTSLRVYDRNNFISVFKDIDRHILMIHTDTYNSTRTYDVCANKTVFIIDTNSPYEDILEQIQEELDILDVGNIYALTSTYRRTSHA